MTGLYVHVPYCHSKCGYCDFYSVPLDDCDTTPQVRSIIAELSQRRPSVAGPFVTIFAGGGTPTVLDRDDLQHLFGALAEVARADGVVEFTTEANPATVDAAKLELLLECGVTRLSFGAQSFHEAELHTLERLHQPKDIAGSVQLAQGAGVGQINIDLIFGIPGQSLASWRKSLLMAIDLDPDHLSCYGLTYEADTPLTALLQQGLITRCDNELEADMYLACIDLLAEHGLCQYEISNFAKRGRECQHNLIYWNNRPYLGIGPSAASYIDGARMKNVAHIPTYIEDVTERRPAWREQERLSGVGLAAETAMLQLRMNRGIDIRQFERRVGINPLETFGDTLTRYAQSGHVRIDDDSIRLSRRGQLIADRIICDLLPAEASAAQSLNLHVLP